MNNIILQSFQENFTKFEIIAKMFMSCEVYRMNCYFKGSLNHDKSRVFTYISFIVVLKLLKVFEYKYMKSITMWWLD